MRQGNQGFDGQGAGREAHDRMFCSRRVKALELAVEAQCVRRGRWLWIGLQGPVKQGVEGANEGLIAEREVQRNMQMRPQVRFGSCMFGISKLLQGHKPVVARKGSGANMQLVSSNIPLTSLRFGHLARPAIAFDRRASRQGKYRKVLNCDQLAGDGSCHVAQAILSRGIDRAYPQLGPRQSTRRSNHPVTLRCLP